MRRHRPPRGCRAIEKKGEKRTGGKGINGCEKGMERMEVEEKGFSAYM
jgi:hypothetical protein